MWQRSHEIICLYISSKPAEGLWEKSGIFGYIDSLWLLAGLKPRGEATAKKIQLEELLVPAKGIHPSLSRFVHEAHRLPSFVSPGSFLDGREGMFVGWTSDLGGTKGDPLGWENLRLLLCCLVPRSNQLSVP